MSGFLEEIWHGLRLKVVHDVNRYETAMTTDECIENEKRNTRQKDKRNNEQDKKKRETEKNEMPEKTSSHRKQHAYECRQRRRRLRPLDEQST